MADKYVRPPTTFGATIALAATEYALSLNGGQIGEKARYIAIRNFETAVARVLQCSFDGVSFFSIPANSSFDIEARMSSIWLRATSATVRFEVVVVWGQ